MNAVQNLYQFSQAVNSAPDPGQLYRRIVEEARRSLLLDGVSVSLLAEDGATLTIVEAVGCAEPETGRTIQVAGPSVVSHVLLTQTPETVNDLTVGASRLALPFGEQEQGFRTAFLAPMLSNGKACGVLIGYSVSLRQLSVEEQGLWQYMANVAAVAIRNCLAMQRITRAEGFKETILNSMPDAIAIIDTASFQVIEANQAFVNRYGCGQQTNVIGQACHVLTHGSDQPCAPHCACPLDDTLKLGGVSRTEHRHIVADGSQEYFEILTSPIRDRSGAVTQVVHIQRDISARRRSEEALRFSQQQLQTVVESLPDPLFLKDGEGRWQLVNAAGLRLFRLEGLPWHNRNEEELIALCPEMETAFRTCMATDQKAWEAKELTRSEKYIRLDDGSGICYDVIKVPLFAADGGRQGLVTVGRDISERKRSEALLVEQEHEISMIFENVPQVMVLLSRDFKVMRINRQALEFTGVVESQMLGKLVGEAFSCRYVHDTLGGCGAGLTCQLCRVRWLIRETLDTGVSFTQQEIRHQFVSGGQQRNLTLFVSTIRVVIRQEPMVLLTMQDITELKELESHLQQAQKMEAIGTLASGIAHDFNNILSAIIGYTDLAIQECDPAAAVGNDLREVRKAADRATALVRQILSFSRKQPQEQVPVSICLIVKEALKLLRASLPSTIEIRQDISTQAMVMADATQIHQLVMNLGTNAYHAMSEHGGVLELCLRETDLDAGLPGAADMPPGQYVLLTVTDTGCGIDQETMARIFDPYFTTKEKGKGTGLGLAVVNGIVKGHHGRIAVRSELGQGTTFEVYLPVNTVAQPVQISRQAAMPAKSRHNERIMVVDDEPSLRELTSQILRQAGYQVDTYANGTEAWEALRQNPGRWNLLLTDQTMPVMTGSQLACEVLKLWPNLPVIICSGGNEGTNLQTQTPAVKAYLQKPLSMEALLDAVSEALHGKGEKGH